MASIGCLHHEGMWCRNCVEGELDRQASTLTDIFDMQYKEHIAHEACLNDLILGLEDTLLKQDKKIRTLEEDLQYTQELYEDHCRQRDEWAEEAERLQQNLDRLEKKRP